MTDPIKAIEVVRDALLAYGDAHAKVLARTLDAIAAEVAALPCGGSPLLSAEEREALREVLTEYERLRKRHWTQDPASAVLGALLSRLESA